MADYTITNVLRVPSRDPARPGKYDRQVFYRPVTGGQIRMVVIADEGFTEQAVRSAILKDEKDVSALTGKTIST